MDARIRLYSEKHGDTVVYDGDTGLALLDFLTMNGSHWGRVDAGKMRMNGTFSVHGSPGIFGGRWWEFEQDRDMELLKHILVPINPFVAA